MVYDDVGVDVTDDGDDDGINITEDDNGLNASEGEVAVVVVRVRAT